MRVEVTVRLTHNINQMKHAANKTAGSKRRYKIKKYHSVSVHRLMRENNIRMRAVFSCCGRCFPARPRRSPCPRWSHIHTLDRRPSLKIIWVMINVIKHLEFVENPHSSIGCADVRGPQQLTDWLHSSSQSLTHSLARCSTQILPYRVPI